MSSPSGLVRDGRLFTSTHEQKQEGQSCRMRVLIQRLDSVSRMRAYGMILSCAWLMSPHATCSTVLSTRSCCAFPCVLCVALLGAEGWSFTPYEDPPNLGLPGTGNKVPGHEAKKRIRAKKADEPAAE